MFVCLWWLVCCVVVVWICVPACWFAWVVVADDSWCEFCGLLVVSLGCVCLVAGCLVLLIVLCSLILY